MKSTSDQPETPTNAPSKEGQISSHLSVKIVQQAKAAKADAKWTKDFVSLCLDAIESIWRTHFGLWGQWRIRLSFKSLEDRAYMEVVAEPHYKLIKLSVNPQPFRDHGSGKELYTAIRGAVVHELLHVLLWRYTNLAKALADEKHQDILQDAEEELVELIVEQMSAFA